MSERKDISAIIRDAINETVDNGDMVSGVLNALEAEGYIIVPKEYSDPISKLKQIAETYNTEETDDDGHTTMSHAAYNLEGALIDLNKLGEPDEVIMNTLNRVANQLTLIGRILGDLSWPKER
jgi:hypothetical protein